VNNRDHGLRELAASVLGDRRLAVVDAGAAGGLPAAVAPLAEYAAVVGFEPDAAECERLNERARAAGLDHLFLPVALAGDDGTRTLHVTRKPTSSSLLVPDRAYHARYPNAERMDVVDEVAVKTRPLGAVLAELDVRPELLKLDVHGVEPEILASLDEPQWASLFGVHVELLVGSYFEGQASFADVDPLFRTHGFELFHLQRHSLRRKEFDTARYSSRGQLEYVDALYLRNAGDPRRFALVAALFGHYDVALAALGDTHEAALVRALAARPRRVRRKIATQLIALGDLGRRWYGATGGWSSSDGPTDSL